jgi:integrase
VVPSSSGARQRPAIHVRDIVKQIYGFAILHGENIANPPDDVGPASTATFIPKDRSLSPTEIRIMLKQLEKVATPPTIRLGMRLYLQTMVRKSELQDATWDEVDFENAVWIIPKERMKREWSNIIDAWVTEQKYVPVLIPPSMPLLDLDPGAFTGRERRCVTSGCCARGMGADRCDASHASTSLRSHTTHRGESAKRRGNSPRCSIS